MSNFDKIVKVWDDLEAMYCKKNACMSRYDFLQKLVGFDINGDSEGRRLLQKIHNFAIEDNVPSEEVEKLRSKIVIATSNLKQITEDGSNEIENLNEFCTRSAKKQFSIYDMQTTITTEVCTFKELLAKGSILPMIEMKDDNSFNPVTSENVRAIYNQEQFNSIVQQLNSDRSDMPLLRTFASFINGKTIEFPLAIIHKKDLKDIEEAFGKGKQLSHIDYDGQTEIAQLIRFRDHFQDVNVVAVDWSARWP